MTNPTTRRALLTAAAALPAALALPAAALAGAGGTDDADSRLQELWQRYRAARRAIAAIPMNAPDERYEPHWRKIDNIKDKIAKTPARTNRGMIIKTIFIILGINNSIAVHDHFDFDAPLDLEAISRDLELNFAWSLLSDLRNMTVGDAA